MCQYCLLSNDVNYALCSKTKISTAYVGDKVDGRKDRSVLISLPIYNGLVPKYGANHTTPNEGARDVHGEPTCTGHVPPNEYRAFLYIT
jgi:hypothetical protein